jgi:hypothetical protein
MKLLVVTLLSLAAMSTAAQKLTLRQTTEMAWCAVYGGRGTLDAKYYADGKIKFSYVLQRSEDNTFRELYVVFWGKTWSQGEMLVFALSRVARRKLEFTINNEGWIWSNKGQLDIRDALWGMYTYRKLKRLLPRLQRRPLTILPVNRLRAGRDICETPVDF